MSTIKDIADEVGISKAAVSRILNHKGSFSQETILKVERAAKRLNYVSRNEMVEGEEESKTIAAIFPDKGIYFSILTTLLEKRVLIMATIYYYVQANMIILTL